MQRGDKIALGTAIPLIALVLIAAIVLVVYIKPCPAGQTYDREIKACRIKCSGGQKYDRATNQCVCPTAAAPVFDPVLNQCVGVCDEGYSWNAKTQSCDRTPQQCYPAPAVNSATGVIVNATHFLDGKGGCSAGSREQLDQLCKSAQCSAPEACRPGDRWDGVDAETGRCYKSATCGLLACDANYCTTNTVRANVGEVMKVADSNQQCVNPSQTAVGAMCTSSSNLVWRAPECYDTTPLNNLQLVVTSASNEAGKGIVGTVQHGLVNGPADLSGDGRLFYTYSLLTMGENKEVAHGSVQVTGVCPASNSSDVCYTFQIDSADVQRLQPSSYLLQLTGYPSWDVSMALYVTGEPQPFTLSGSSVIPGALTQLDVKFDKDAALKLAADTLLVRTKLKNLTSDLIVPDLTVTPLCEQGCGGNADVLVADCQSGICRTNETITRKFVVLAWLPLKLDKYALAGICPSGEAVIKYFLSRTHTDSRGVIEETLIGPTPAQLQPSNTEIETGIASFIDVVDVNRAYTYKLGAYLADSVSSTLEYRNAKCFGALTETVVTVGPYTAAGCHAIKYGKENSMPPNMTVTSAGTCEYNNTQPAKDYYCLYEYGGNNFDPAQVHLSSENGNSCYNVLRKYPAPKTRNTWTSPFATTASYDACITGETQELAVLCPNQVQLDTVGDFLDKSSLEQRFKNVYDNFDTFNYDKSYTRDALSADNSSKVFDEYANCPPRSDTRYGNAPEFAQCAGDQTCMTMILKKRCAPDDEMCKSLVQNANCGYNNCGLWERFGGTDSYEYRISRSVFFDDAQGDASAKCCNGKGKYTKGKCTCDSDKIFGVQCDKDPCEEQFREHRAKGGFDCTPLGSAAPTGTCVPDGSGNVSCVCNTDYFNVAQPPPLDIYKDCKWYKKQFINNPASPSGPQQFNPFNDNPQKKACEEAQRVDPNTSLCDGIQCQPLNTVVYPNLGPVLQRDDSCIVDPYSCKCPEVLPDPYMCRQLELPKNQKGGNVFPDPMNPKESVAATGCNVKCSEHKPTESQPYKFADPENNNLACTTCHVGGSCEEVQDTYNNIDVVRRQECFQNAQNHQVFPDKYPLDETCIAVNSLQNSKLIFPEKYCKDCCFYFCKKNSHDHHWCDNGKWRSE